MISQMMWCTGGLSGEHRFHLEKVYKKPCTAAHLPPLKYKVTLLPHMLIPTNKLIFVFRYQTVQLKRF